MRTYGIRLLHGLCALALLNVACSDDTTNSELGEETETGDGDPGDGDGDPGDGDGDPGDGDGDPGDGDGDPGDGDGDPGDGDGDGDSGDGDGDGDPGDGDGDPGDGDGDGDGDPGDGDGDGDPGDGDGDGDPGDGDGDTTGNLTCDELEQTYEALAASSTACETDDQCQVVFGHCFIGLGGCWYVVNDSMSQTDLDELANQFEDQGCSGAVCFCIPPPDAVGCVDNTCQEL